LEREAKSGTLFSLLLISILALAFNIQTVRAIGTIYIRSDGSIDPPTAPIQRDGDMYVLTDNITSSADNGIVIQRNNMTLDGADYTLQGPGGYGSTGIFLSGRSNVTIRNMEIMAFDTSILLEWSSNNNISGNTVIGGFRIIMLYHSSSNIIYGNYVDGGGSFRTGIHVQDSSNNIISENTVTNVSAEGIRLLIGATNNSVFRNIITNNSDGIWIQSSNNTIAENNIVNNVYDGMVLQFGSLNNIYHNNFINNTFQVVVLSGGENFFDDGYPSGGNYWSDHIGTDNFTGSYQNVTGSDGIGDAVYVFLDEDNQDNYPLMNPWTPLVGDVDGDGDVDRYDFGVFAGAYGTSVGQPRYHVRCDLDQDGDIDRYDYGILAGNYGKTV